ncbi:hypothetical protein CN403_24050 [Bacillus cereus]|nr:hypothetical protein CN403_24050 [Bacillus cereus]
MHFYNNENNPSIDKSYDENINNIFRLASKTGGSSPLESIKIAIEDFFEKKIIDLCSGYSNIISDLGNVSSSLIEQISGLLIPIVKKACLFDYSLNCQNEKKIQDFNQDYWESFQSSYPVVIEQFALHIQHIITSLDTILNRVNIDRCLLSSWIKRESIKITKITIELGDVHKFGESVALIELNDVKVIYKPRNASTEELISNILDICSDENKKIKIGVPQVINKESYSWHEYITFENCSSIKEIYEYYENIGGFICFAYALYGSDFHYENIIAKRNIPYILDMECMFIDIKSKNNLFSESVLDTNIIPTLSGNKVDTYICGIGNRDSKKNIVISKDFKNDSSGNVVMMKTPKEIPNKYNRPLFDINSINVEHLKTSSI